MVFSVDFHLLHNLLPRSLCLSFIKAQYTLILYWRTEINCWMESAAIETFEPASVATCCGSRQVSLAISEQMVISSEGFVWR